jgi:hypothetical protein
MIDRRGLIVNSLFPGMFSPVVFTRCAPAGTGKQGMAFRMFFLLAQILIIEIVLRNYIGKALMSALDPAGTSVVQIPETTCNRAGKKRGPEINSD